MHMHAYVMHMLCPLARAAEAYASNICFKQHKHMLHTHTQPALVDSGLRLSHAEAARVRDAPSAPFFVIFLLSYLPPFPSLFSTLSAGLA